MLHEVLHRGNEGQLVPQLSMCSAPVAQEHGQNGALLPVPQHKLDPHDFTSELSLESWAVVGPQLALWRAHEEEDTFASVIEFPPVQDCY